MVGVYRLRGDSLLSSRLNTPSVGL